MSLANLPSHICVVCRPAITHLRRLPTCHHTSVLFANLPSHICVVCRPAITHLCCLPTWHHAQMHSLFPGNESFHIHITQMPYPGQNKLRTHKISQVGWSDPASSSALPTNSVQRCIPPYTHSQGAIEEVHGGGRKEEEGQGRTPPPNSSPSSRTPTYVYYHAWPPSPPINSPASRILQTLQCT